MAGSVSPAARASASANRGSAPPAQSHQRPESLLGGLAVNDLLREDSWIGSDDAVGGPERLPVAAGQRSQSQLGLDHHLQLRVEARLRE